MLSIDVMKNMKMGQSVQVTTDKECFYALITEITDTKVSVISETGKQHTLLFSDMGGKWKAEISLTGISVRLLLLMQTSVKLSNSKHQKINLSGKYPLYKPFLSHHPFRSCNGWR